MVLAGVGLAVSACGAARPPNAALDSAGRLLSAAHARDRVAFEAEIDRPAVREDLRRQVAVLARGSALDVDGGPSDFALDRMVAPGALTVIGAPAGGAPPRAQLARLMKVIDRRHVCLRDAPGSSHCLLTFARGRAGAGRWRLVGMTLGRATIRLAELDAR